MPANDAKVTLLRSAEIGAGLMPSPYAEAVARIRELEAAPTSAEVEAMANDLCALHRTRTAKTLISLSRQVAVKDAEIEDMFQRECGLMDMMLAERDALRAEVVGLRRALVTLRDNLAMTNGIGGHGVVRCAAIVEMIDAALDGKAG